MCFSLKKLLFNENIFKNSTAWKISECVLCTTIILFKNCSVSFLNTFTPIEGLLKFS